MNYILSGGRLTNNIISELNELDSNKRYIAINYVDTITGLVKEKGSSYFRNIDSLVILDTGLGGTLTDWSGLTYLCNKLNNKIIFVTRYNNLIPDSMFTIKNLVVWDAGKNISIDNINNKLTEQEALTNNKKEDLDIIDEENYSDPDRWKKGQELRNRKLQAMQSNK